MHRVSKDSYTPILSSQAPASKNLQMQLTVLYLVTLHNRIAYKKLADAVALDRRRDVDSSAHRYDCTATSHKAVYFQESSRALLKRSGSMLTC